MRQRHHETIQTPDSWDYVAVENVMYHGCNLTILWDKTGRRYNRGAGVHVFLHGKALIQQPNLARMTVMLT
jgi:hypothetical protein